MDADAHICAWCRFYRFTTYEEVNKRGWKEFGLAFCNHYNAYFPNQQHGDPVGLRGEKCIHWQQKWKKPEEDDEAE